MFLSPRVHGVPIVCRKAVFAPQVNSFWLTVRRGLAPEIQTAFCEVIIRHFWSDLARAPDRPDPKSRTTLRCGKYQKWTQSELTSVVERT
jgi:hypothetical protein